MLLGHFAKRVCETLFVHRYSGSLDGGVGGFIGTFYALLTLLISAQQAPAPWLPAATAISRCAGCALKVP